MRRVLNKKVVITGAGSGIGQAVAKIFSDEGAQIILVGRNKDKLNKVAKDIRADVNIYPANISSEQEINGLKAFVERQLGGLDILVNNAGTVLRNENILETEEKAWEDFMGINLKGPFLMCKALIPFMQKQQKGAIVNVASQLALVSAPGYSSYSTAKNGIVGFTRSLAIDYGTDGIRANCVSPGLIATPMAYVGRENFDDIKESIADSIPLKRIGRPEDIANAIFYLASDESDWVTGTNLVVDGGYTAK